jgi:MFS family permease
MRYYGWTIVAISVAVLTLVVGASIYAFGLFVLPVSKEFGLSRAEINTGIILLNFGMALFAPFLGQILDRHSCRRVMTASAILFAASFIALGLSRSGTVNALVLMVPLAIAVGGAGTLTSTTVVARWFSAQRGRAMAIAAIGISLGPLLVVPEIGLLIGWVGWRSTLIIVGITVGTIIILLAPFVRERPGAHDIEPEANALAQPTQNTNLTRALPPLSIAQFTRHPEFWAIALAAALGFGVQQTTIVSLVPYAIGKGFPLADAAALVTAFGTAAISGKIVLAWLSERINRMVVLASLFALLGFTSAAFLLVAHDLAYLTICSLMLGLATGATTPAFLALLADRFGAASFGTANGSASLVTTLISAFCLRFGGEVFDRTGSYDLMFGTFVGLSIVSALIMLALWVRNRPTTLSA